MTTSKDQHEVNGELDHLLWKKDLEPMDLMKLHSEEHEDVENEINNYLYGLEPDLTKEFFNNSDEKFSAYKEAQDYFNSDDFEKDLEADEKYLKEKAEEIDFPKGTEPPADESYGDGTKTTADYYYMYYQPIIYTKLISNILREFKLKDTRQNRFCIAMVERKEEQMCSDYGWNEDVLASRVRQIVGDLKSTFVLELKTHENYGMYTEEGNRKVHNLVTTSKNLDEAMRGLPLCGDEATDTVVRDSVKDKFPDEELDDPIFGNAFRGSASLNSMQGMRASAEAFEHGNKNKKNK